MNIQEILSQLKFYKNRHLPRNAIKAAIENKNEITPDLINILNDAVSNTQKYIDSQTLMWHIYAVYILAHFREPKAYPLIVEMLSKPNDIPFDFFGDSVTEDMGKILAAVCHGDLSLIKKLIEGNNINEYVRSAGIATLLTLYVEKEIDRDEIIVYFRELFQGKLTRNTHFIWASLVSNCSKIYANNLLGDIKQAFKEELPEPGYTDLDYITDTFNKNKDIVLSELYEDKRYHFMTDIITEMENWSSFDKLALPQKDFSETNKVGRNDPCPCGSGKKFKKCCLH